MDKSPPTEDAGQRDRTAFLLRWLALLLVVILAIVFYLLEGYLGVTDLHTRVARFLEALIPNLAVVLIVYLITRHWLERHGISSGEGLAAAIARNLSNTTSGSDVAITRGIADTDWAELTSRARQEIRIVGRFFDSPVRQMGRSNLEQFFRRGGSIHVLTSSRTEPSTWSKSVAQWNRRWTASGGIPDNLERRQDAGLEVLVSALRRVNANDDQLRVYTHPLINYAGYSFDSDVLLLVPYAHDNDFEKPPPRFTILLDRQTRETAEFWKSEWKDIETFATRLNIANIATRSKG